MNLYDSKYGSSSLSEFFSMWYIEVCFVWSGLSDWRVYVCVCVWRMVQAAGRGSASCSLLGRKKGRFLSRGSASWVCCWPDQLAVCLAGVWHITTKGLGADRPLHSSYQPPNLSRSTSFPFRCSLSSGMQSAQTGTYGSLGRSNVTYCWSLSLSAVWRYTYWTDHENFLHVHIPAHLCTYYMRIAFCRGISFFMLPWNKPKLNLSHAHRGTLEIWSV